jgi:hypothetical protein
MQRRDMSDFSMDECFEGVMFGLAKGIMPDFQPIFVVFSSDLKREAEKGISP